MMAAFGFAAMIGLLPIHAPKAEAAIITVTYEGVVISGYDASGVFGKSARNLAGLSYIARYTVNDLTPANKIVDPGSTYLYGGSYFGFPSSPVRAELIIDGVSAATDGRYAGSAWHTSLAESGTARTAHSAWQLEERADGRIDFDVYNFIESTSNPFVQSADFRSSFSYVAVASDRVYGRFNLTSAIFDPRVEDSATGYLEPRSVTISVSAIPEPLAWVFLIAGFGFSGLKIRHERRLARCQRAIAPLRTVCG